MFKKYKSICYTLFAFLDYLLNLEKTLPTFYNEIISVIKKSV